MEENAVHAWWKHPLSSLVASERAGGLVRAPTWFLLGYLLFLITPALYSERGIFADTGFLWFAQSFFLGAALLACLGGKPGVLEGGLRLFWRPFFHQPGAYQKWRQAFNRHHFCSA